MKVLFLLLALVGAAFAAEPAHPIIPNRTFLLKDYNPAADGITPATEAFRRALSVCARAGGGTIVVPAGRYLTGPLDLCSNLNLRLEAGAVILFVQDFTAYAVEDQKPRPLLQAVHCHDVMISGAGTIDGQGQPWWEKQRKFTTGARVLGDKGDAEIPRPRMVVFDQCERVRLEGVTLTNSPSFHLMPEQCKDVTIDGVTIVAPEDSPNTEGIDLSVSSRVLITRCRIDVGDDCIAIKAGHLNAGPCKDVTVTDCTFLHGHGLSIGSETTEGVRNLTVSHCTFDGTETGIRLKSERGRGGLVENLSYSDITMKNVGQAIVITSYYRDLPKPRQVDAHTAVAGTTPFWRNIRIRNVTADCTKDAGLIIGLPEMPAQDITLENVSITAPAGLRVRSARNVNLVNTRIIAAKGKPLLIESNVDNLRQSDSPPAPAAR